MRLIRLLSEIMIHRVAGKIVGIGLMLLPIVFMFTTCAVWKIKISWLTPIYFVGLSYLGLFLGGFIHECGHVVTLRLLGCKSTISIMRNPHSNIIFFNMRTNLLNDHPLFSTSDRLLVRALSGFFGNMVAYLVFLIPGVLFANWSLLYLAMIQGFSGHGATSLSDMNGDTDVRTLREGLSVQDQLGVEIKYNEAGVEVQLTVDVEISDSVMRSYWILMDGIKISKYDGDLIIFDMGSSYLFVPVELRSATYQLQIVGDVTDKVKIVTKNSTQFVADVSEGYSQKAVNFNT